MYQSDQIPFCRHRTDGSSAVSEKVVRMITYFCEIESEIAGKFLRFVAAKLLSTDKHELLYETISISLV